MFKKAFIMVTAIIGLILLMVVDSLLAVAGVIITFTRRVYGTWMDIRDVPGHTLDWKGRVRR